VAQQVSTKTGPQIDDTVPAGEKSFYDLPTHPRGYSALVGSLRSTESVSVYLLQGKTPAGRWLSGRSTAVDVTGAAENEENEGAGEAFGWNITSPNALLCVDNPGESDADILLEMTLVGVI